MIHNFKEFTKIYESKSNFNKLIDYTYLKNNATTDNIKQLCDDAEDNNYYSVWNPKINKQQVNKLGNNSFIDWFKELEEKQKNEARN